MFMWPSVDVCAGLNSLNMTGDKLHNSQVLYKGAVRVNGGLHGCRGVGVLGKSVL